MEQKKELLLKLKNGVRLVIASAPSSASYIGMFVATGSRDDGKNLGISHLIEHTIFKGTSKKNYSQLMDMIESVGGEMNAYTAKEETCYQISIANDYIENAFSVLSEIFFDSQFPENELEKEKTVVIDEIESYEDVPNEMIFDEFEEQMFQGHSLATNILGTKKSVKKLQQIDLIQQYKKKYVPENLVVSYVGSVDYSKIEQLARKYFENVLVEQSEKVAENTFVSRETKFDIVKNKRTHQAHCMMGSFAPSIKDDLRFATAMVTNILGGISFNALLNMKLREERGLTYNIEANYTAYSDTGFFSVYFGTDFSKVPLCREIIADLFNEIITNGFTEEKLEAYKKQIIGQFEVSDDNYMSLMINNAKSFYWFNHIDSLQEVIEKVKQIDNNTIKQVAKLILSPENLNVLIYK